jgi:hypothetical protein
VYLQCLELLNQWMMMFTVDQLFALNDPALTSVLSKKSFSQVSLPTFASISSTLGAVFQQAFRKTPHSYALLPGLSRPLSGYDELYSFLQSPHSFCRTTIATAT